MGYHRCLGCGILTGIPERHPTCPATGAPPAWERCTCGSGAHPRACDLHPGAYEEHMAELNAEDDDATD